MSLSQEGRTLDSVTRMLRSTVRPDPRSTSTTTTQQHGSSAIETSGDQSPVRRREVLPLTQQEETDNLEDMSSKSPSRPVLRQLEDPSVVQKALLPPSSSRDCQIFMNSLAAEEMALLRETTLALQGINGSKVRFYWNKDTAENCAQDEGVRVRSSALNAPIPPSLMKQSLLGTGAKDAILICGEAGWLYTRILTYVSQVQLQSKGSIVRAFASSLACELQSYRNFLSQLQVGSLRQLLVAVHPAIVRLETLALVVDGVQQLAQLTGPDLLMALHRHSQHGDLRHSQLVQSLLSSSVQPWINMCLQWTMEGKLVDPANEFFVTDSPMVADTDMWRLRYRLDKTKVPTGVMDVDLIGPIYLAGKGINYIRKCLRDESWSIKTEKMQIAPDLMNEVRLRTQRCSKVVHQHILNSLRNDHCMMDHLFALKQFLLLGQGDFFFALMEGIHEEYQSKKGIVGVYRHALSAIVESALRSTNASSFPDFVLDRLDVQLLLDADDDVRFMFGEPKDEDSSLATKENRTVWDIFCLTYRLPDPMMAIVPLDTMELYQRMFSFLFGLKKIEFMLNTTWRQSAVLQHQLQTYAQYNAINVSTSTAYAQALVLLRRISMTRQAMMHFVANLKSYLMFEVLEGGWKAFEQTLNGATTLDEVISAHENYIGGICRKSLLREGGGSAATGATLQELLRLSGNFCEYQELLFNEALEAAERAALKRRVAEDRMTVGDWGFQSESEVVEEETSFGLSDPSLTIDLEVLTSEFNDGVRVFLRELDSLLHGGPLQAGSTTASTPSGDHIEAHRYANEKDDLDSLRFLVFQLGHNDFYGIQQ